MSDQDARIAREHAAFVAGLLAPRAVEPEAADVEPERDPGAFLDTLRIGPVRDREVSAQDFAQLGRRDAVVTDSSPEGEHHDHEGDLGDAGTFAAFARSLRRSS